MTYANAAKMRLLGVPEDMLRVHGAVSPEVARCMAQQARREYGADFGLGITGVAGPDGGTPAKPAGLVYVGPERRAARLVARYAPPGALPGRERTRRLASSHALDMLRRCLAGLPVEDDWALENNGTAIG